MLGKKDLNINQNYIPIALLTKSVQDQSIPKLIVVCLSNLQVLSFLARSKPRF